MYKPPTWVNKAPHEKNIKDAYLEVCKNDETIDRIDLCDKPFYTIGRNSEVCDITSDHASISRVHAAIVFHPGMKKFFVHDNNSVHGTFIGKTRIGKEPKALMKGHKIGFGASTRGYILRRGGGHESEGGKNSEGDGTFGSSAKLQRQLAAGELPLDQVELDQLTEKNTQLNLKQAANLSNLPLKLTNSYNTTASLNKNSSLKSSKKRKPRVNFQSSTLLEEVINIYDIDEKIGKFKNLVNSTEIIDEKRLLKKRGEQSSSDQEGLGLGLSSSKKPKLSLGMLDADANLEEINQHDPNKPKIDITVIKTLPGERWPSNIPVLESPSSLADELDESVNNVDMLSDNRDIESREGQEKNNDEKMEPDGKTQRLTLIEQLEKEAEIDMIKMKMQKFQKQGS